MNKLRKVLYGVLVAVFAAAMALTVAACTTSKKYTLTFMDGETQITQIEGKEGEEITAPVAPDKTTQYFAGWYLNADLSGNAAAVPSAMPAENVTYYAKYANKAVITLDADGGSLASSTVYLKPGDNLYTAMQSYQPSKTGLTFGGWFRDNGYALAEGTLVNGNITLRAKYKVEYSVEVYVENLEGEGYTKDNELSYTDLDFVGEEPDFKDFNGLLINYEKAETKLLDNLDADKTKNNFVYYLDRSDVTLTYFPTPDHRSDPLTESVKYGAKLTVTENTYEADGYRYYGWVDALTDKIYKDGDEIEMNGNVILYAVWDIACTDRFGGNDVIYVLSQEEGKAVLYREGLGERTGTVTTASNGGVTFEFSISQDEKIVGKIASDNTFAYYRNITQDEMFYFCFDYAYGELAGNIMLELDGYLNATLTNIYTGAEIYGTYAPAEEEGLYLFSVLNGVNAGYEFYFKITEYADGETNRNVFIMRGDEYEYGEMYGASASSSGNGYYGFSSSTRLLLDGFGNATLTTSSGTGNYYYEFVNGNAGLVSVYTLVDGAKREIRRVSLMTFTNGMTAFITYNGDLAGTYGSDAGSLTLDGYAQATYNPASGSSVSSTYLSQPSVTGGYIITFPDGDYKFMINGESLELLDGDYGEFYWLNGGSFYYAPHMVVYGDGTAELYSYSQTGYSLAAIGTYEKNGDYYVYTQTELVQQSAAETMPTVMEFSLDTDSYTYSIYIMRTAIIGGKENTYYNSYNGADGFTLEISDSGLLTYIDGLDKYSGYWDEVEINEGYGGGSYYEITVVFETQTTRTVETIYVLLDKDAKTYTVLDFAPTYLYYMDETRTPSQTEGLFLDGKGGAKYYTLDADGKTVKTETGTYVLKAEKTAVNEEMPVYTVTVGGKTFDIITVETGNYVFFYKYNSALGGEFTSTGYGTLVLDGFGYQATYTDKDGNEYEGEYYVNNATGKPVVLFAAFDEFGDITDTFVIDAASGAFTVRDNFSGTYFKTENGILESSDSYFVLDGYGNVEFHNGATVTESGTYVVEDEDARKIVITKTDSTKLAVYLGLFDLSDSASIGVYAEKDEELANYYVSADWTVMYLDGTGNATFTDKMGLRVEGEYMSLNANLIYFDGEGAEGLYLVDKTNKVISKLGNSQYFGNYYDKNLKPLILNNLGSYEGLTSLYAVNGSKITIYQLDGFRHFSEVEGTVSGDTITVNGKIYTKFTAETKITLTDSAIGATLTFTPDADNTAGVFTAQYKEGSAAATNVTLMVGYDAEYNLVYNFGYAGYIGSFRERTLSVIYTVSALDCDAKTFTLVDRVSTQTFYDYNYMYASLYYMQAYSSGNLTYASYYQAMQQAQLYYGGRVSIIETYTYADGKTTRTMSASLNTVETVDEELFAFSGVEYQNLGATQDGQVYRVEYEHTDGSTYVLSFLFNSFAYQNAQSTNFWAAQISWYRASIKTVTSGGYSVKVYQYLAGNYGNSVAKNTVMNFVLYKGSEELAASALDNNNGKYTYNVITGTAPGKYTVEFTADGEGVVTAATVSVDAYTKKTMAAGDATLTYLVDNKNNYVALYSMVKGDKELSLLLNAYETYVSGSSILENEGKMVLWYVDGEQTEEENFFYELTLDSDGNPVSVKECSYLNKSVDGASLYVVYTVSGTAPEIVTAFYSDAGMIYQATPTYFAQLQVDESNPYYVNFYCNAGQYAFLATVDNDKLVLDDVYYSNVTDEAGNRVYFAHGGNNGVVYAVDNLYVRGYGYLRASDADYTFEKTATGWKVTTPFNTYTITITSQNGNYSATVSSEAKTQTLTAGGNEIKLVQNESGTLKEIQSVKVGSTTYTEGIEYKAITNYAYYVTVDGNNFYIFFDGDKHEEASFEAANVQTLTTADGKYQVTVTYTKRGNINRVYDLYLISGSDKTLIASSLTANGGAYEYAASTGSNAGLYSAVIEGNNLTVGYSEIKTAYDSYTFTSGSSNEEITRTFTFKYILNADGSALRLLVSMVANELEVDYPLTYNSASALPNGGYRIRYIYGSMNFYFYFDPANAEKPLVYARTAAVSLEAEEGEPAYAFNVFADVNLTTVYAVNAMGINSTPQTVANVDKNPDGTWTVYIANGDNAGKYTVTFGNGGEDGTLSVTSVVKAASEYKSVSGSITEDGETLTVTVYYLEKTAGEYSGYAATYALTSGGTTSTTNFTFAGITDIGNGKYWMVFAYSSYYFHFVVTFGNGGKVEFASYYYFNAEADGDTYRAYIVYGDDNSVLYVSSLAVVNEFGEYETISAEVNYVSGKWIVTDGEGNAYELSLDADGNLTVTVTKA